MVGRRAGGDNCAGDPDISCGGRRTFLITIGPARKRDARLFHQSCPRVRLVVDGIVQQGEGVHNGPLQVSTDKSESPFSAAPRPGFLQRLLYPAEFT